MVKITNKSSFWDQFKVLLSKTNKVRRANLSTVGLEIVLPLWMIGVLAFTSQSPGGFDDADSVATAMIPITQACIDTSTYSEDFRLTGTLNQADLDRCIDLAWAPNTSAPLTALMDDVWTSLTEHAADQEDVDRVPVIQSYATIEEMEEVIAANRGSFAYPNQWDTVIALGVQFPSSAGAGDATLPYPFSVNVSISVLESGSDDMQESGMVTLETALASAMVRARRVENGFPALEAENFSFGLLWDISSISFPALGEVDFSSQLVPFYLLFGMIPAAAQYTVAIVTEKERGITAAMTAVGMNTMPYFLSWGLSFTAPFIVTALLMAWITTASSVFPNGDFWLLALTVFLFGATLVPLAMAIAIPISKPKTGGGAGAALQAVMFLVFILASLRWFPDEDFAPWVWAPLLLSPVAFGQMMVNAGALEAKGEGFTWDNLEPGDVSSSYCMVMLVVDLFLYYLVLVWLAVVFPGAGTGNTRHPLFFLQSSFWKPEAVSSSSTTPYTAPVYPESTVVDPLDGPSRAGTEPSVVIRNVSKTFKPSFLSKAEPVKAVVDYSLDLYKGEVLALLGHNGAGKSTLIKLLSALFPYDSGKISMHGFDPLTNPNAIHHILGVCPQQDVLWDELTAEDNLRVYAGLKGLLDNGAEFTEHIEKVLTDVCLGGLGSQVVKSFSGGMKRKLSVAIALLGDAQVVLLDEPTTGMDPASRKDIWGLFQSYKQDRTMVLTTHSMEEADLLGDRVAIMGAGQLLTLGSSSYLKGHFGDGYTLALTKASGGGATEEEVLAWFSQYVPGPRVSLNNSDDMHVVVSQDHVKSFPEMFTALKDSGLATLGMTTFGISCASLEDVFLKVAVHDETPADDKKQ